MGPSRLLGPAERLVRREELEERALLRRAERLLGERKKPNPEPGRLAKAEAVRTYRWYLDEMERLGL